MGDRRSPRRLVSVIVIALLAWTAPVLPLGMADCHVPGCHQSMHAGGCAEIGSADDCCLIDGGRPYSPATLADASVAATSPSIAPVQALVAARPVVTSVASGRAFFELPRAPIFLLSASFLI